MPLRVWNLQNLSTMHINNFKVNARKGGLVMVKQFKETQMEGRRLLHLGIAACMLMLVMVICHAEPVLQRTSKWIWMQIR